MKALDTFRRKLVTVAGLALALLTMEARAGDLTATGKKRWLTIASESDELQLELCPVVESREVHQQPFEATGLQAHADVTHANRLARRK